MSRVDDDAVQGWSPVSLGGNEWLLSFRGRVGIRLTLPPTGTGGIITGRLELPEHHHHHHATTGGGHQYGEYGIGRSLLTALGAHVLWVGGGEGR